MEEYERLLEKARFHYANGSNKKGDKYSASAIALFKKINGGK